MSWNELANPGGSDYQWYLAATIFPVIFSKR